MESWKEYEERKAVREGLERVLTKAAKGRKGRKNWVLFERLAMRDAVNEHRRKRGLPLVSADDIEKVETMALGHSDYMSKFALYCSDLVVLSPRAR